MLSPASRSPFAPRSSSVSRSLFNQLTAPPVIFPISPGTVETDMAKLSREKDPAMVELQKAFPAITPEESARGILEHVDISTRETHGGQFVDYSGLGKWQW